MPNLILVGGGGGYGTLSPQTTITAKYGSKSATLTLTPPASTLFSGTLIVYKEGSEVPIDDSDGVSIDAGVSTTVSLSGLTNGVTYTARAFAYNADNELQTELTGAVVTFTPRAYKIYGFKVERANSDPETRVTYTNDAVGFTPVPFNSGAVTNYGSWEEFINEYFTPVMLNFSGEEDYELSRSNQTFKSDGVTPSDISNFSYAGDAMVRVKKLWIKMWDDETYNYCNIATDQVDETYKDFAYINEEGVSQDRFYVAMYRGSYEASSGRWRSIAGRAIFTSGNWPLIPDVMFTRNSEGYYPTSFSQYCLITMILVLLGKSTNLQRAFGCGNTNSPNPSSSAGTLPTGETKTCGAFWGDRTTGSKHVKTLWIEDWWGQQICLLTGAWNADGTVPVKMFPPYYNTGADCSVANGYTKTLPYYNGTYFIKDMEFWDGGFSRIAESGASSSTYWADVVGGGATSRACGFGGYAYNNGTFSSEYGDSAGPFSLTRMYADDNRLGGNLGMRLAYLKRGV